VPAAIHNRDLWPSFLTLNNLPANTPHSAVVLAAEKAVLDSLRDGPTEKSAALGNKLLDAYVQERTDADSHIKLVDADFHRRISPCPAPTTAASATARIAPLSMKRSPDEFYPVDVRNAYLEGRVVVAFSVSSEGCAVKFAIAHSSGSALLDIAAVQFMETMEFRPAAQDGKPIESVAMMPVKFQLMKPELPPVE
jgi:TonB family protein